MFPPRQDSLRAQRHASPSSGCPTKKVMLGILLSEAHIVSPNDLSECVQLAEKFQKPIGRVLVETNRITELDLENALLAQSMIQEGFIERADATYALKYSKEHNLPFAQVTKWAALDGEAVSANESLLLELILSADLVSERAVEEASRIALEREISVAGALLKMRAVPFSQLNVVVECLKLINDKKLNVKNACEALKLVKEENIDLAQAFEKTGLKAKNTLSGIKIGDILLSARVVSEQDLLVSLERSINDGKLLGELLLEAGILSKNLLDEALFLQNLCKKELLTRAQAARVIKKAYESNMSAKTVAFEMNVFRDDQDTFENALGLLIQASLTTQPEVVSCVKRFSGYGMDPLFALVAAGDITSQVYRASIELARLVKSSKISCETAVKVLYLCDISNCEYKAAFHELGLKNLERIDSQIDESIESGIRSQLDTTEQYRSKEVAALTFIFVTAIVTASVLNSHLPQAVVAIGSVAIIAVASACGYFAVKLRAIHKKESEEEFLNKSETCRQEVSRLKRLNKNI